MEWVLVVGPCAGRGMVGAGWQRNTKGSEAGGRPGRELAWGPENVSYSTVSDKEKNSPGLEADSLWAGLRPTPGHPLFPPGLLYICAITQL